MTIQERDAARYLRIHLGAYGLGIGILLAVDLLALPGWWFFWPTLVWGCLLLLHYFYVKSIQVDRDWVEARVEDVRLNAYDLGHIESIEERYKEGPPTGGATAETESKPASSEESPSDRRAK